MANIRASSEPYALLNARTIRESLGATWGLSETGASGPTGNRYGDAAGHACIAVAGPIERVITLETGDVDREANMWTFCQDGFGTTRAVCAARLSSIGERAKELQIHFGLPSDSVR